MKFQIISQISVFFMKEDTLNAVKLFQIISVICKFVWSLFNYEYLQIVAPTQQNMAMNEIIVYRACRRYLRLTNVYYIHNYRSCWSISNDPVWLPSHTIQSKTLYSKRYEVFFKINLGRWNAALQENIK
jgi:hypothetical protein